MSADDDTDTAVAATQGSGVERAAPGEVRVKRALLSVSDKAGIVDFARGLAELGVEIVSTGGTASALADAGIAVRAIEGFTGFPEMMDGRVKTLHPRLYAGLLALRDDEAHLSAAEEQGIEQVDLVCVNLYPFEQTIARGDASEAEAIENIDIGGPTMIRAAAKNQAFAAVLVDPGDYGEVLGELRESQGRLTLERRKELAAKAFACTARYDAAIATWFAEKTRDGFPLTWHESYELVSELRYGENPHQSAAFYARAGASAHLLDGVEQLHGKELSFNNLLDLQLRARIGRGLRGAGVRDPQAQQPVRVRARREPARGLRARLRVRPGKRLRRRDRRQPPGRSRRRRAHERAVHRGPARAGLRRGRAGGAEGEKERQAVGAGQLATAR